jgi:hypothetical protein
MKCLRPLEHWAREFESHSRHGRMCAFILCVGKASWWTDHLSKESYQLCIGLRHWKSDQGPTKGCRAIEWRNSNRLWGCDSILLALFKTSEREEVIPRHPICFHGVMLKFSTEAHRDNITSACDDIGKDKILFFSSFKMLEYMPSPVCYVIISVRVTNITEAECRNNVYNVIINKWTLWITFYNVKAIYNLLNKVL